MVNSLGMGKDDGGTKFFVRISIPIQHETFCALIYIGK